MKNKILAVFLCIVAFGQPQVKPLGFGSVKNHAIPIGIGVYAMAELVAINTMTATTKNKVLINIGAEMVQDLELLMLAGWLAFGENNSPYFVGRSDGNSINGRPAHVDSYKNFKQAARKSFGLIGNVFPVFFGIFIKNGDNQKIAATFIGFRALQRLHANYKKYQDRLDIVKAHKGLNKKKISHRLKNFGLLLTEVALVVGGYALRHKERTIKRSRPVTTKDLEPVKDNIQDLIKENISTTICWALAAALEVYRFTHKQNIEEMTYYDDEDPEEEIEEEKEDVSANDLESEDRTKVDEQETSLKADTEGSSL